MCTYILQVWVAHKLTALSHSFRGSTEAIKHAQHLLSLLIKDPAHNIASILPKSTLPHPHTITSTHSHTHRYVYMYMYNVRIYNYMQCYNYVLNIMWYQRGMQLQTDLLHVVTWSHTRQLIYLRKSDCLGCAVLLCLVVCLTLLASFPSFSSLIKICT